MRRVLWSFDAFALVESRTLAEGPVYSVVESYVLGGAEKVRT
jgi:2'-5' RNA ligase